MDLRGPFSATCPTRELLDQLADKWSMLVLIAIANGPIRFNALKRTVEGISQKVLTQTLRQLEHNGFITRTAFPTVPVTVEYAITPLGVSLVEILEPFRQWAINNIHNILEARRAASQSDK
jgi:DNA-binding HxlR family transcriptional regulator